MMLKQLHNNNNNNNNKIYEAYVFLLMMGFGGRNMQTLHFD